MDKLHFSTRIEAPKAKVWKTMLDDATYRAWTEPFSPGSYFEGDWSPGSKMRFLGPDKAGGQMGMVSRVEENRPEEFISVEHLGVFMNGREDTTSETAKSWAGAHENYTFKESAGATEVVVDTDVDGEFKEMMQEVWPKALERLKELAEK